MTQLSSLVAGAGGIAFGGVPFPGYLTGFLYPATIANSKIDTSAGTLAANRIYYWPFQCRQTHTFTGMAVYQRAAAPTGNIRLGVYDASGAKGPGTKFIDAGVAALPASTGLRTVAASIAMVKDTLYWLCAVSDVAATISGYNLDVAYLLNPAQDYGAFDITELSNSGINCRYAAFTYGALNTTAPTPTALGNSENPGIVMVG